MMSFNDWWLKHWNRDIQSTSKHINACRYALTDCSAEYEKELSEMRKDLEWALSLIQVNAGEYVTFPSDGAKAKELKSKYSPNKAAVDERRNN
jgi:hypothetical protein